MSLGSLWTNVPLISGAVSAASGLYGAYSQQKANNAAISGQQSAAAAQQAMAQEQWDYYKNTYMPKAMAQADDQLALSKRIADAQLADAAYYRGVSEEVLGQAKKSWKYQDQYMGLTDDYMSGKVGNIDADRANADVEQAYGRGLQSMMRQAQRYGINPGSGAFAATMGDMYNEKMLAGAGAQTAARQAARQKAESMVAVAAGAGQAGFGTGMSAGQLAGSSLNGAGNTNNTSLTGMNSVANTFGQGATGAGANYGASSAGWNNVVRNAGSPVADYVSGLAAGGLKTWAANQTAPTSAFRWNDPYRNPGYFAGDEGE
jgi:hypothetical protein